MDSAIPPERFPQRLAQLGFQVHVINGIEVIIPPVCTVPAGPFSMGSDPKRDRVVKRESWGQDGQPQHTVTLPGYEISRFPVTVAEYACFVRAGYAQPRNWRTQQRRLPHPVVKVTWHDAVAYAAWLSERTGEWWRLATEAEWEKAARGTDGRIYPWGDTFDKTRCNTLERGKNGTTPVGTYPTGASPYGVQDMAGNVWEWTSSRRLPYPYLVSDGREAANSPDNRVLRGGSFRNGVSVVRAANRFAYSQPNLNLVGFRLVRAASSS
jgi:formylglycine-generating enzyme required for sulfatase activity